MFSESLSLTLSFGLVFCIFLEYMIKWRYCDHVEQSYLIFPVNGGRKIIVRTEIDVLIILFMLRFNLKIEVQTTSSKSQIGRSNPINALLASTIPNISFNFFTFLISSQYNILKYQSFILPQNS